MRSTPSFGVLVVLVAVGCATSDDEAQGTAEAAVVSGVFDADLAKGAVALTQVDHPLKSEFCVALNHLPDGAYREGDTKKEKTLCAAEFYIAEDAGEEKATVICPKIKSSNPGTDVYEVPKNFTKEAVQTEATCNNLTLLGGPRDEAQEAEWQAAGKPIFEKVGKFKQSVWCSHTGAILAAYHVSRALGDIVGVPAAVLRTMDKVSHRELVTLGAKITKEKYSDPNTAIRKNWNEMWPCVHKGSGAACPNYVHRPIVWDDDVLATEPHYTTGHLVGAFMANASDDGKYDDEELEAGNGITSQPSVESNRHYKALKRGEMTLPKEFKQETVQGILAMKDISDFLVLDTIIEQQDRFSRGGGNLNHKKYLVWSEGGVMKAERKDKRELAPDTALTVPRMVIEDNDCGLRNGMRTSRHYDEMIEPIRHLAPSTYIGLQKLAQNIDGQHDLFTIGMTMNEAEFARTVENIKSVASGFKAKCQAGQLLLDLDVDAYIAGTVPSCRFVPTDRFFKNNTKANTR